MLKPKSHISSIRLNDDTVIRIPEDGIVVFVGPNNSGKTQALKDIHALCKRTQPTTVIKAIKVEHEENDVKEFLEKISSVRNSNGSIFYEGLNYSIYDGKATFKKSPDLFGDLREVFVTFLDTMSRLQICNPAANITPNEPKNHPIQFAAFEGEYRKWISEKFKSAFGEDLIPNTSYGAQIPLSIGKSIKLEDVYEDEQSRQEEYARQIREYKQIQDQGDGVKSFSGILLYLMLEQYSIFLIDEPESFLHPPQAYIMGQVLGESLNDGRQAFISTHSEDILRGLLDVCPQKVTIIRITREEDRNSYSIINKDHFDNVWKDPILRHSNIIKALFHTKVVLCESDSDCRLYSIIENDIERRNEKHAETFYINCGGKHRMEKIISALRMLGVRLITIVDLDVLDDENVLRRIVEASGCKWDTIQKTYRIVSSSILSQPEQKNRERIKQEINQIIDSKKEPFLSENETGLIRDILRKPSEWSAIKRSGIQSIPAGDATRAFKEMDGELRKNHIFLVPVGQIENFIKDVGGHGPTWVNNTLEKYPNLEDDVYSKITEFINNAVVKGY